MESKGISSAYKNNFHLLHPRVEKNIYVHIVPSLLTRQVKASNIPKRIKFSTPEAPQSKPWLKRVEPYNWTKKYIMEIHNEKP